MPWRRPVILGLSVAALLAWSVALLVSIRPDPDNTIYLTEGVRFWRGEPISYAHRTPGLYSLYGLTQLAWPGVTSARLASLLLGAAALGLLARSVALMASPAAGLLSVLWVVSNGPLLGGFADHSHISVVALALAAGLLAYQTQRWGRLIAVGLGLAACRIMFAPMVAVAVGVAIRHRPIAWPRFVGVPLLLIAGALAWQPQTARYAWDLALGLTPTDASPALLSMIVPPRDLWSTAAYLWRSYRVWLVAGVVLGVAACEAPPRAVLVLAAAMSACALVALGWRHLDMGIGYLAPVWLLGAIPLGLWAARARTAWGRGLVIAGIAVGPILSRHPAYPLAVPVWATVAQWAAVGALAVLAAEGVRRSP